MKKALCILIFLAGFAAQAQKPRKADAKDIISKTLSALRAKDSVAFRSLFLPDTSGSIENTLDFISPLIHKCYNELQSHLKEVIGRNIGISSIRIEPMKHNAANDKTNRSTEYEITARFVLDKQTFRSVTFPSAYYRNSLMYLGPCSYGGARH